MSKDIKKYYEPTNEECDGISRASMMAAFAALEPLDNVEKTGDGVLICLGAFKAATGARREGLRVLLADRPGYDYVRYYEDMSVIVCSAMFCFLTGLDPSECACNSEGGARLSIMFKSAKVLEAMSDVYAGLDDDDGIFGTYLAEEAVEFAESLKALE